MHAVCPDGVAGDMIDAMDPAGRAKSIVHSSGRLLTAQGVAEAALGLIGLRRVVLSLPARRGGLTRLGQLLPSQFAGGFRLFELVGRRVMRRP